MASLAKSASGLAMAKGMETRATKVQRTMRTMATIPWKEFQNTMAKAKVTKAKAAKTNIKTGGAAGTRTHGCRQTVSNCVKSQQCTSIPRPMAEYGPSPMGPMAQAPSAPVGRPRYGRRSMQPRCYVRLWREKRIHNKKRLLSFFPVNRN